MDAIAHDTETAMEMHKEKEDVIPAHDTWLKALDP